MTGEVTHDVPEDVRQTIEWNWKILVQELEWGLRVIRVIAIVRVECDDDKRTTDACALDCRIRAAIETNDLIGRWAHDLGRQGRADIRRQGAKLQGAIH
eukprot:3167208-Pyramimonas_sp.AAC.1